MTQPIYRSTDANAPVIDNTAGTLCNTLDAVLVNGYGVKAPLGWSIKFSATNRRVYKMGAGTGFELRVDEVGLTFAAKVRPAESYSAIDTFTGGFPTVAQRPDGVSWQKSSNNTTGARPWVITGDRKRFFISILTENDNVRWRTGFFGDIVSYKPGGDPYACMIFGMMDNYIDNVYEEDRFGFLSNSLSNVMSTHYIARAHTGIGTSLQNYKYGDTPRCSTFMGTGVMSYPDPITGGIHLSRVFVSEPSPVIAPRGYVPGLWVPCHHRDTMAAGGAVNGNTFNGSDGLSTRTFELRHTQTYGSPGAFCFETSDWPESA